MRRYLEVRPSQVRRVEMRSHWSGAGPHPTRRRPYGKGEAGRKGKRHVEAKTGIGVMRPQSPSPPGERPSTADPRGL